MLRLGVYKTSAVRLPMAQLQLLFARVVKGESTKRDQGLVNLIFTDDKKMRALNHTHRHKDKPTDVLSFNVDPPESRDAVFGEIYISTQTAARQAADYGGTLAEEYLRLTCHGLLHLFGYDHQKPGETRVMKSRESRYLGSAH